jgi:hypothetical protein
MPVFYNGDPITGSTTDDYIAAIETGGTTINAGDGYDVVYGDSSSVILGMDFSAAAAALSSTTDPTYAGSAG